MAGRVVRFRGDFAGSVTALPGFVFADVFDDFVPVTSRTFVNVDAHPSSLVGFGFGTAGAGPPFFVMYRPTAAAAPEPPTAITI